MTLKARSPLSAASTAAAAAAGDSPSLLLSPTRSSPPATTTAISGCGSAGSEEYSIPGTQQQHRNRPGSASSVRSRATTTAGAGAGAGSSCSNGSPPVGRIFFGPGGGDERSLGSASRGIGGGIGGGGGAVGGMGPGSPRSPLTANSPASLRRGGNGPLRPSHWSIGGTVTRGSYVYVLSLAIVTATAMVVLSRGPALSGNGFGSSLSRADGASDSAMRSMLERIGRLERETQMLRRERRAAASAATSAAKSEERPTSVELRRTDGGGFRVEEHKDDGGQRRERHNHKLPRRVNSESKEDNKRQAKDGKEVQPKRRSKAWERTKFTLPQFVVAGVNLAAYKNKQAGDDGSHGGATKEGASSTTSTTPAHVVVSKTKPFTLYDDFDLSSKITGTESWSDLINYRRQTKENYQSLAFYVDRVAQGRWLNTVGVPQVKPLVLKYKSELLEMMEEVGSDKADKAKTKADKETNWREKNIVAAIRSFLPKTGSYAAEPSHTQRSHSVLLVEQPVEGGGGGTDKKKPPKFGRGGHKLKTLVPPAKSGTKSNHQDDVATTVSKSLATSLHDKNVRATDSYVRSHGVRPGLVVEERYVSYDDPHQPPDEFQVTVLWGKVYVGEWVVGSSHRGWVYGDGTVIDTMGNKLAEPLPSHLNWSKVVEIAERLGSNKDMYRVDVLVGVPADSPSLVRGGAAKSKDRREAIQVVVCETEIAPRAMALTNADLLEEGARLWIAGYMSGNYRVAKNEEVPRPFAEKGWLAVDDVEASPKKGMKGKRRNA